MLVWWNGRHGWLRPSSLKGGVGSNPTMSTKIKGMKKEFKKCLVLDSSYMPRQVIDSLRAYVVFSKGNAEIIANHTEKIKVVNPDLIILRPSIIRIPKKYINLDITRVPYSRDNVLKRDNYTCVYCNENYGDDKRMLSIDHVLPQSKGGKDSFENCVTACKQCNWEKDDLTIEEWGREHPNPRRPHYLMMLKSLEYIPEAWMKFMLI